MSPKKLRINFMIDEQLRDEIVEYRFNQKRDSMSDVYRELIEMGLAASRGQTASCAPSPNAVQLAAAYDCLDVFGQIALKETADREQKRMEAQQTPIRRPLAARNGNQPLDLATLQPISVSEVEQSDINI